MSLEKEIKKYLDKTIDRASTQDTDRMATELVAMVSKTRPLTPQSIMCQFIPCDPEEELPYYMVFEFSKDAVVVDPNSPDGKRLTHQLCNGNYEHLEGLHLDLYKIDDFLFGGYWDGDGVVVIWDGANWYENSDIKHFNDWDMI